MINIGRKRKIFSFIVAIIFVISIFYGCSNEEEETVKVKLNSGSIAVENSGDYEVYNYDNEGYEKIQVEYVITYFDSESGNYIFNDNRQIKVKYLEKELLISKDDEIYSTKLSRGGKYLSYFTNNNGYRDLNIINLDNNTKIDINSNVYISGELLDWLDKDTLVYYGVDNNKNNGLFLYNITTNTEEILYKLESGYIEYLKVVDNGLVFVQEKEGKQKSLKFIDKNGELSNSVENIVETTDIEVTSKGIYILGKMEKNNYSLYEFNNGKVKRLVYDFPNIINLEKGLSKDSNGNILFMGKDESGSEKVYICNDGAISLVDIEEGNHYFIEYN